MLECRGESSVFELCRWVYGAYYHCTAEQQQLKDLVCFFLEAWDHPSSVLRCKIVDQKRLANIPKELTSKVILKRFPSCEA